MMTIKEIVKKYQALGANYRNAQNLAAEEIIINKLASSPLAEHVTLKGGIVMYNLTKSNRRVTQDIDFDMIRYSIEDESIEMFIRKLNSNNDGFLISMAKRPEKLHQEDYQGVRVFVNIKDFKGDGLRLKLDIGVHTYAAIEQNRISFSFDCGGKSVALKVNPCEQIFAEKSLSLSRLGPISSRYKDIYDLYYLINNKLVDLKEVAKILNLFFISSRRGPNTMHEYVDSIITTLNDELFSNEAKKPVSNWIDEDYVVVKSALIEFLCRL
ncbi:MAG: nucleotidyl transferase AbiEii/AbiGii toxin family protein [Bacilli bacterium]|nr:nucleotidyl transferase AbiEii/AbiGii toxin family protein [Bacilli bacterium]